MMDTERGEISSAPYYMDVKDALKDPNLVKWDETPRDGKEGPLADPANPQGWSNFRKGLTLSVVALSTICVTCASSIANPAYGGIKKELHVSSQVVVLSVSLYTLGLGLGPLLLAPLSEFFGRRPIYLIGFSSYVLLGLPVSFASHFGMLATFRFFTGVTGSAFLSVVGGTVADLWTDHQTFMPIAIFTVTPFLGRILGPIIGSFIAFNADWRWVFWFMNIWSAVMFLALVFLVPETYAPMILTHRAKQLRKETGNEALFSAHELVLRKKSIPEAIVSNSTKIFELLALEPMLCILAVWSSLLLGILYLLFAVFPIVFAKHHFNLWQTGLTFLGILIGMMMGIASTPWFSRRFLKQVEAGGGSAPPEARLPMAMVGSILAPISLFWFAFTTYKSVHWIVPVIASVPYGIAILLINISIFSYITDTWRPVAASALGANIFMRSVFACFFPLFTPKLYAALGTVNSTAMLAALNMLMVPVPFVIHKYGSKIRARSRYVL